jgi:signal peptidase I
MRARHAVGLRVEGRSAPGDDGRPTIQPLPSTPVSYAAPATPQPPQKRRRSAIVELIETLAITLVLFLAARASLQPFTVQGQSMEPTLHNHEYILVEKVSYWFRSPERGDIVVFRYPGDPSEDYIKRVIGLPGDHVVVHDGHVYVNGRQLTEPYIAAPPDYTDDRVVAPGDLYVLGDNRDNSSDSHEWGLLPRANIIGRAWIAYWPLPDLTILHQPSYSGVH